MAMIDEQGSTRESGVSGIKEERGMKEGVTCPKCGTVVHAYRNPFLTVDIIIELKGRQGIVLIRRAKPPYGWALPGGFVDYGESLEAAARREAREETSLEVDLIAQLGAYSSPDRDPRHHTVSVVFVARAAGEPRAASDAQQVGVFSEGGLPGPLAFDHARILADYYTKKRAGAGDGAQAAESSLSSGPS
jgi:8-oxo-dGTP diphosphatase